MAEHHENSYNDIHILLEYITNVLYTKVNVNEDNKINGIGNNNCININKTTNKLITVNENVDNKINGIGNNNCINIDKNFKKKTNDYEIDDKKLNKLSTNKGITIIYLIHEFIYGRISILFEISHDIILSLIMYLCTIKKKQIKVK